MQSGPEKPTAQERDVSRLELLLVAQGLEGCQLRWGAIRLDETVYSE